MIGMSLNRFAVSFANLPNSEATAGGLNLSPSDEKPGFALLSNEGRLGLSLSPKDEIEPNPYFGVLVDDGGSPADSPCPFKGDSLRFSPESRDLSPDSAKFPDGSSFCSLTDSVDLLARLDGGEVSGIGLAVDKNEIDSFLKVAFGPTLMWITVFGELIRRSLAELRFGLGTESRLN